MCRSTRLPAVLLAAGCAFLFAPRHHAALRHAAGPRVELGTRTIFNLLGPLANPAGVKRQLIGVFDPAWARPMAETLAALGTERAWIVHGEGLDELTVAGENQVVALNDGRVRDVHACGPRRPGCRARRSRRSAAAMPARERRGAARRCSAARPAPYRDTVLLNAAAALIVAGRADDLREGVAIAARVIDERCGAGGAGCVAT